MVVARNIDLGIVEMSTAIAKKKSNQKIVTQKHVVPQPPNGVNVQKLVKEEQEQEQKNVYMSMDTRRRQLLWKTVTKTNVPHVHGNLMKFVQNHAVVVQQSLNWSVHYLMVLRK